MNDDNEKKALEEDGRTTAERIMKLFARDSRACLTLKQIEEAVGIKNAAGVLSSLVKKGALERAAYGLYRFPTGEPVALSKSAQQQLHRVETRKAREARKDPPVEAQPNIDEETAEDIRIAERRRILGELAKAVADAVPKDAEAYIQGFKDGANFVSERVLGLMLPEEPTTPS